MISDRFEFLIRHRDVADIRCAFQFRAHVKKLKLPVSHDRLRARRGRSFFCFVHAFILNPALSDPLQQKIDDVRDDKKQTASQMKTSIDLSG
jgi:hypothetical protein